MRWRVAAMLFFSLFASPRLVRADSFNPISVGVQASTLGYGVVFERPLLFNLSARVSTGWLSFSGDHSYDGNDWSTTFKQQNVLVAIDWRPYAGRWRLSGGLLFSDDELDLVARSYGGTYALNGNVYPASQAGRITGRVAFDNPAPYVGFGAGTGISRGLTIAFDAGIVLRNGTSSVTATGLAGDAQFQSDLAAVGTQFRTRFLEPVISVGLVYRP